ncbi:MAG: F0F1 ATP synthase subunit alpha, partial [Acidimicrobiales bacterium]
VSLFAGTRGHLDNVPVGDVPRFEGELIEWFRTRHADILDAIASDGKIPDSDAFEADIVAFAEQFESSEEAKEEPETEEQGEERRRKAGGRGEGILPEEEISRDESGG